MPNKYNNVKTSYKGSMFDSKAEVAYCMYLDSELASRRIVAYDRQVSIPIHVNGIKICKYVMDFIVEHKDHIELVEVKGFETSTYRLKKKLLEATYLKEHPTYKFTVVKV